MKTPFFNIFLPLLILLTLSLFVWDDEEPVEKSETDLAIEMLEDITFNKPPRVKLLFNEQFVDKQSRIRYNTLIFKTDKEFMSKSPKNPDSNTNVLDLMKENLPEYNFGTPIEDKASYSHMLLGNAEWTVVSIESDLGHFSKWVKKVDVNQLLSEDI